MDQTLRNKYIYVRDRTLEVRAFQETQMSEDWNFHVKRDSKEIIIYRQDTCLFSLYFKYFFPNCELSAPTHLDQGRQPLRP